MTQDDLARERKHGNRITIMLFVTLALLFGAMYALIYQKPIHKLFKQDKYGKVFAMQNEEYRTIEECLDRQEIFSTVRGKSIYFCITVHK